MTGGWTAGGSAGRQQAGRGAAAGGRSAPARPRRNRAAALVLACLGAGLAGCGGNVITRLSTTWVDIRPNPTAIESAKAECREEAGRPDAPDDIFEYCMRRHGWVAMSDPLLD